MGAVATTWFLHEFAHWLMSLGLGYDSLMTLNTVSLTNGVYNNKGHAMLVSAAGPVVTILQATIVFMMIKKGKWNAMAYPFLFVPLYSRLLAGAMNVINLNDEGRISHELGIGNFTISILVIALLGYFVYSVSSVRRYPAKFQGFTVLLTMFFSSVLILSDQFFEIVLLKG